jgi:hypothetical protein
MVARTIKAAILRVAARGDNRRPFSPDVKVTDCAVIRERPE